MRRWGRVAAPFVVAVVTIVAIALSAGAHDTDLRDPNDTRGKLDVREVLLGHEPGPPRWTVITFARWSIPEMWDRGYVEVLLDTKGDDRAEYYILVRSNRKKLEGTLWRLVAVGPDPYLGAVAVDRRSLKSVTVEVGLWRLTFGGQRDFYRWWIHTVYTSEICRRTCHDRAPNRNAVLQWRPGMSPSPSESPTESPSP
jgi:hypothetical protein